MSSASWASSESIARSMRNNRGRDTRPEMAVRRRLHAAGYRYRVDLAQLPALRRRADIVFRRARVAVFIDGCFWHGCPAHHTYPKTNAEFWRQKVEANRARDLHTTQSLREAGWTVIRAWEHDTPEEIVDRVISELANARRSR